MQVDPGPEVLTTLLMQDAFRDSMELPAGLDPHFRSALEHVLEHPGSLVRPRMVLQMAAAYGLDAEPARDLAIALEYFHTASLIFDDLPCMDNAERRRGAPCTHVAFGESGGILAALALINRAYALTWRALAGVPRERQQAVMEYVEHRLGVNGLLNGQSLDLNYAHLPHTRESTERVALGKTVSLIRLTLVLPALLAAAPPREIRLLERISTCWGLSYQMVDDLKDVLESAEQADKTVARDRLLDRPNVAVAIGVESAILRLTRLMRAGDRALRLLLAGKPGLLFLSQLRDDLQGELERVMENALELSERELA